MDRTGLGLTRKTTTNSNPLEEPNRLPITNSTNRGKEGRLKTKREPDFAALRNILQKDLKRKVSDKEARKIGRWILRFYAHMAYK